MLEVTSVFKKEYGWPAKWLNSLSDIDPPLFYSSSMIQNESISELVRLQSLAMAMAWKF